MEIQGLRRCSEDVVQLDLGGPTSASLSIDDEESAEARIQRLISEHPVIIFSRNSCCMCHVMKKLLATIGVHPTVIELDDHEIPFLPTTTTTTADHPSSASAAAVSPPSVFIGGPGSYVGGLEALVALHLSGHLIPKLVEVGAL
ncbi:LOW QUALITY PROTEIN: glutaredoxin-C6 [Morus notabilis]|uniref:LOW QUALITY PROTEIN: glutaredoxin-C6 n=1 Tax=Morus notabilis TaxID=981085 RepID=UPI000CED5378|nr:LOW QUALITY PROTEIN: glutaredoxin-C6 [Morus notabilis]